MRWVETENIKKFKKLDAGNPWMDTGGMEDMFGGMFDMDKDEDKK